MARPRHCVETGSGASSRCTSPRRAVVSFQRAGNSDRPPIRYNTPFTICVRGLCHGIQPRVLPACADRSGVVVSHTLLGVAIRARSRATGTTHARDATPQTLHGAQTLPRSHPYTPLRPLCTGCGVSPCPPLCSVTTPHLDARTPAPGRHLPASLIGSRALSQLHPGSIGIMRLLTSSWSNPMKHLIPYLQDDQKAAD